MKSFTFFHLYTWTRGWLVSVWDGSSGGVGRHNGGRWRSILGGQSINQSINQSIQRSIDIAINHSIHQSINTAFNQVIELTFLSDPVREPGHVAVAVEGVGDQVQRLEAGQLIKRTRGHAAARDELIYWFGQSFVRYIVPYVHFSLYQFSTHKFIIILIIS